MQHTSPLKPSLLTLTRPRCPCSSDTGSTSNIISSRLQRLLDNTNDQELWKCVTTHDSLRNWNIVQLKSSSCTCDYISPTKESPSERHPRLVIEATMCPIAVHSVTIVSNLDLCGRECEPCNFGISQDFLAEFTTHESNSQSLYSYTLLDLALLIRFIKIRVSCGLMMDRTKSGCDTMLCLLVPLFRELHYPWVEPPVPARTTCSTLLKTNKILSIIRDFEEERTRNAIKDLENAERERTKRLWSILTLRLKLEKLENRLSAQNMEQCPNNHCQYFVREEYHFVFHFGRELPGESHYIQ